MGSGISASKDSDRQSKYVRKASERKLNVENFRDSFICPLVVLGSEGLGKQSFKLQLTDLHASEEIKRPTDELVSQVHRAVIKCMSYMISNVEKDEKLLAIFKAQNEAKFIKDLDDYAPMDKEVGTAIRTLWKDPAIALLWKKAADLKIDESLNFLFKRADELSAPNYVPNNDDLFISKLFLSGSIVHECNWNNTIMEFNDVQDMSDERWVQCFQYLGAVLLLLDISQYESTKKENNHVEQTFGIMENICTNRSKLSNAPIMLVIHNVAGFREKMEAFPIQHTSVFADYSGPCDAEHMAQILDFIVQKFRKMNYTINNDDRNRQFYHIINEDAEFDAQIGQKVFRCLKASTAKHKSTCVSFQFREQEISLREEEA